MVEEGNYRCPTCGGTLKYHDSIPRIVKTVGGVKRWDKIQRLICQNCRAVHREIPDYLFPFKHYEADIIKGFIVEQLSIFDLEYEDYPSEGTIKNWIQEYDNLL